MPDLPSHILRRGQAVGSDTLSGFYSASEGHEKGPHCNRNV